MSSAATVRRVVSVNDARGRTSRAVSDGPSPDVRLDPARPGFAATRLWLSDTTPVELEGVTETLHLPHTLEPPPAGSVCRVVSFPPDASWNKNVSAQDVKAYFAAMGSPSASTYGSDAPHPYMQRTRTLDFCVVLDGEITLVLDLEEVALKAGDTVVQRGTNHAWSNRSNRPCTVLITSHDGVFSRS